MSGNIQAHIISPQENLDLPIFKLIQMANSLLSGSVSDIEEKLDGQNITLTVINGQLQFFNKGLTPRRLSLAITGEQPGNILSDMGEYADPGLKKTFELVYREIDNIFQSNAALVEKVFKNGNFVIESSIMGPENKNTITYDKTYFRMIQFVSMYGNHPDYTSFSSLSKILSRSSSLNIRNAPILEYLGDSSQYDFVEDITNLAITNGLTQKNTIGELTQKLTESYLKQHTYIPIGLAFDASRRLSQGKKSALSHRSFSNKSDWKEFQELENRNTFAQAALFPLEEIMQRLAFDVFNSYRFELSDNVADSSSEVKARVAQIIDASNNNNIKTTSKCLLKIRDTIKRLDQLSLYEKDVEGVVFDYEDQKYKLTGIFTPINKLLGYFHYNGAEIV
tara:strand:+ start:6118 stop:7296 length:1179 start_codon:yes stop_codon:yes gene_type:complete